MGETSDDQYALDVLGSVLSGPRTARLTKALVYDKQAAASVTAFQNTNENVGEFMVMVVPRPGNALTDIEAVVDTVVATLKKDGPTAEEIQKATAGLELGFLRGLESNLNKAMMLCDGAGFHADAGYFEKQYKKYLAVTAADVTRVANTYLTGGRVVLSVVPSGKADQASRPAECKTVTADNLPRAEVK